MNMRAAVEPPAIPVGKIKSFGPFGPKYEVGPAVRQLEDGDWLVEVTMVETGEKAEYRFTHLAEDPEAR
jgi:hypothetical protein